MTTEESPVYIALPYRLDIAIKHKPQRLAPEQAMQLLGIGEYH